MKTHCLQHKDVVIAWVRIILALGTNHLNFGYESSGYETSVGTKRPVSLVLSCRVCQYSPLPFPLPFWGSPVLSSFDPT